MYSKNKKIDFSSLSQQTQYNKSLETEETFNISDHKLQTNKLQINRNTTNQFSINSSNKQSNQRGKFGCTFNISNVSSNSTKNRDSRRVYPETSRFPLESSSRDQYGIIQENEEQIINQKISYYSRNNSNNNNSKYIKQPQKNVEDTLEIQEIKSPRNSKKIYDILSIETDIQFDPHENNELMMDLMRSKVMFQEGFRNRQFGPIIQSLKNTLTITIKKDHPEMFVESLILLGSYYSQAAEISSAFHIFNSLQIFGNVRGDNIIKLDAMVYLGDTALLINNYKLAQNFYKIAIQYAWLLDNEELEIMLYDQLGYTYFQQGNMKKAIYYHNRSMNSIREAETSQNKLNSSELIKEFNFQNNNNLYRGIDNWLLARMGLINNNPTSEDDIYKFSAYQSPQQYIEGMQRELELCQEYADPTCKKKSLIKKVPEKQLHEGGYVNVQEKLQNGGFEKSSEMAFKRINNSQKREFNFKIFLGSKTQRSAIDKSNIKIDLDTLLLQRSKESNKVDVEQEFKRSIQRIIQFQSNAKINIDPIFIFTHESPNRNMKGFRYFLKIHSLNKINKYFVKIHRLQLGIDLELQQLKKTKENRENSVKNINKKILRIPKKILL